MTLDPKKFAKCLGVEVDAVDLSGLAGLFIALGKALPKIASPDFIIPNIGDLPTAVIKLFIDALPSEVPNFKIPELGISFTKGVDLGVDVFLPEGMIKLITLFVNVALGVPELFVDIKAVPPLPKVPTPDAVLGMIEAALQLPKVDGLDASIKAKIAVCLAEAILGLIPIPG